MKNQKTLSLILLAVCILAGVLFLFSECNPKTNRHKTDSGAPAVEEQKTVSVPEFNADSAFALIEKQVSFGPRIPGTPAQVRCADWMKSKLASYNARVYVQELEVELWNGQTVPCKNVIGEFNSEKIKRILLCAHWDTRPWSDQDATDPRKPFDGADDGASGVGVLLEAARQFSLQQPDVGIDIVFFDVEDYGPPSWDPASKNPQIQGYCLGSQEWASSPHVPGYRAYFGILLDMVGAGNATFYREEFSVQYAPSIVDRVWNTADLLGYSNHFIHQPIRGVIDDHVFVNRINATPTIDIIHLTKETSSQFARHWHTQQDQLSVIERGTLKAVGQTLLQVIYSEAGAL
jgi:hypothetical protein